MSKLNWKLSIACLTFFTGTLLTLIWLALGNKEVGFVKMQPSVSTIYMSEVEVNETAFDNKTLATINVDSKNEIDDTDFNPPIRLIKNGGKFCEKYILRKIALEKSKENKLIKLKNFNPQDENLSLKVKDWLDSMDFDELQAVELKDNQQKALLLSSRSNTATGLAANLEALIIDVPNFYSNSFLSFSRNPKLLFWDKNGLLNYYRIVYSDAFIQYKDWENLTFNIEHYRISDGRTELIKEETNLSCK
ncbi:MAG: hypothetical protein AAB336_03110 [Acidobacteriota bacterium]